jgi:integrase
VAPVSIQARRTKSGVRYDVKLRDPAGHMYQRTFRTKREAETYQARELADRSRGAWIDPRRSDTTFAEWAQHWLESDLTKRAKTVATDQWTIKSHLVPALGPTPLGAITPLDVQRLVRDWSTRYKPAGVRRRYAVLRAILNAAVDADLLGRSPCRGVKLPALQPTERTQLSAEDMQRLADSMPVGYKSLIYVGGVLGLRFGECAALRVRSLDTLRSSLTVSESLGEVRGRIVIGPPKSAASRRTLLVPAPLMAMLSAELARRGITGADPDGFVFAAPEGGPLRYGTFRSRVWLPTTNACGLEGLGFHDLRRAAATAMVALGIDVRTAQARLGHSDPRTTLGLYAQATRAGDRAAADKLGAHFMADPESSKNGAAKGDDPTGCGMDVG